MYNVLVVTIKPCSIANVSLLPEKMEAMESKDLEKYRGNTVWLAGRLVSARRLSVRRETMLQTDPVSGINWEYLGPFTSSRLCHSARI